MANVLDKRSSTVYGKILPLIVGLVSVPLTLMFDTDSFFFGMLPVLIGIGNEFGVNPAHIAIAMVVCRNCATFISGCSCYFPWNRSCRCGDQRPHQEQFLLDLGCKYYLSDLRYNSWSYQILVR